MLVLDVEGITMGFLGEMSLLKTLLKYLSEGICKGCSFLGDLPIGFVSKVSSLIKDCLSVDVLTLLRKMNSELTSRFLTLK
jgi:hypothetical protein